MKKQDMFQSSYSLRTQIIFLGQIMDTFASRCGCITNLGVPSTYIFQLEDKLFMKLDKILKGKLWNGGW